MRLVLACDLDSTIWPAESKYDAAAMELYGEPFGGAWYPTADLIERFGPEYYKIFELALSPAEVETRPLYPGVPQALSEISEIGFDIHFISKTHIPEKMRGPLKRWLSDNLDIEFGLSLTTTDDKLHLMRRIDAVGLIDDRVDLAYRVHEADLWAAVRAQKWNKELSNHPEIRRFRAWNKVPSMVELDVVEKIAVGGRV